MFIQNLKRIGQVLKELKQQKCYKIKYDTNIRGHGPPTAFPSGRPRFYLKLLIEYHMFFG